MQLRGLSGDAVEALALDVQLVADGGDLGVEAVEATQGLALARLGSVHVAVRDNIEDYDLAIVVETAYQPDPALWDPTLKRRRKRSR